MADNVIFNVNGVSNEDLLTTLKLAFKLSGSKARAWSFDKKKGLILHWYEASDNAFPCPLNAEDIYPIVLAFLKSEKAKEVICEGTDANIDHDGHNKLGWRIYTEQWSKIEDYEYSFLAIKPAYIWYGK